MCTADSISEPSWLVRLSVRHCPATSALECVGSIHTEAAVRQPGRCDGQGGHGPDAECFEHYAQ